MDGITILNTYKEYTPNILFLILLLISIVCLFILISDDYKLSTPPVLIGLGLFAVFCFVCLIVPTPFSGTTVTHYQITIDESVKYMDFMQKYEIISANGALFDVIEKQPNK